MIQHIFKIIWTERKINSWIVFELVLVFCILWFCVDYISFFVMRYFEPRGFSIEHVYTVNFGLKEEGVAWMNGNEAQKDSLADISWMIADRIKKYPDIEAVSISWYATPYSDGFSGSMIMIDSIEEQTQIKKVTPDFFKVFGMKVLRGNPADWNNENDVFISGNKENLFAKKDVMQVKTFAFNTGDAGYIQMPAVGVVAPSKRSEFDPVTAVIYMPLLKNKTKLILIDETELCVRVKSGADKGFIPRFTKDMQEQLSVDPYFLSSVNPMSDVRKEYMKVNGYDNNFKSIFSISAFLFINIFLAVVGTFWFRIQTRRGEIGLRVALGSTLINIKTLFILETLILLLLASIIATVVCVNIAFADIVKDIGVPSIGRGANPVTFSQYVIDYGITLLILMIIAVAAVWYPAKQASEIPPAEALHDE